MFNIHFTSVGLMVLTLLSSPASVSAGECEAFPPVCGSVTNNCPERMYVMTGSDNAFTCNVWNNKGGNTPAPDTPHCNGWILTQGKSLGGWTLDPATRLDIDFLTFPDTKYWVEWLFGGGREINAGTYTKIQDHEHATCNTQGGRPFCTIRPLI
ncbi:hypothetical protein B0T16DRAFT_445460 [Cercophora newfieldiana]|uniref:Uncharacterized protein n=1 Tax=Cercophora newfieldiana TaxID=92897 RepID=A0AA40CUP8_9PEZI|nr:hypothetical protein B0T16DRAFT_445460 [Cercophora newfieldiana]